MLPVLLFSSTEVACAAALLGKDKPPTSSGTANTNFSAFIFGNLPANARDWKVIVVNGQELTEVTRCRPLALAVYPDDRTASGEVRVGKQQSTRRHVS
jgi:hypothetical protein